MVALMQSVAIVARTGAAVLSQVREGVSEKALHLQLISEFNGIAGVFRSSTVSEINVGEDAQGQYRRRFTQTDW